MLHFHQSNRLELLADGLASVVAGEPLPPLVPETVLVQASGMSRWLSFGLARRLGIAANLEFAFPASWVWSAIANVVPGVPRQSPLEPEWLSWRLLGLLAQDLSHPGFAPLRRYLDDGDALKRYELAVRLAETLDGYLVYRPDWIDAWSASRLLGLGDDEAWQAALWRGIAATLPPAARVHPRERFLRLIDDDPAARSALPARLHLFGIESLPPLYLDVFRRIAAHVDVHLWLLAPCREYWSWIVSARRQAEAAAAGAPDAAYLEVGNPLLASMGRHAQDFFDRVAALEGETEDAFVDPLEAHDTLLGVLQSDVLNLRMREAPVRIALHDRSFSVQVCHGPMREIEVLHDQLLARFERDGDLAPADVLVLIPDLEAYAPYVDAVFGTASPARAIPYSIADRGVAAENEAVRAFRSLLVLAGSRLQAEEVVARLEIPLVARRFGIAADDLARVRDWIGASGIRWGADEHARASLGLPATRASTWRAGLDRLFLGYAMSGDGATLYGGTLPGEDLEGSDALLLARLADFVDRCAHAATELARERTPAEWRDVLERLVADFLAPDESEARDVQAIRDALVAMVEAAREGGCGAALPLAAVRMHLEGALAPAVRGHAFLAGGVTFAALRPGRPIPARVICLLGMNDGAFPRDDRRRSFDLAAARPRPGDRSPRAEDRYAFLQALLGAREALYVSYAGRDLRDNAVRPPSPLVTELLDVVAHTAGDVGPFVVAHPLHAFSTQYGREAGLFTYNDAYARRAAESPTGPAFAGRRVPPRVEAVRLELASVARFLRNPARAFLEGRLGIRLEPGAAELESSELFVLDGLERYAADQRLFELVRAGRGDAEIVALLSAEGLLPHGAVGAALAEERLAEIRAFADVVREATDELRTPVDAEIETPAGRLAVRLDGVTPRGRVAWRVGRLRTQDLLDAWLHHLALNVLGPAGVLPATRIIGLHQQHTFAPVAEAAALLDDLVDLHGAGAAEPLPLFPESSRAFVAARRSGKGGEISRARSAWVGSDHHRAESDDAYMALAFRGADPIADPRFPELAERVFGPLLEALDA